MTSFESNTFLNKPIEEVYAFLEDCNNHEKLQPDNVYNWSSTKDEATFTIKNMSKLALKVKEREENAAIRFVPVSETPFDLSLNWLLTQKEGKTEVRLELNAELNMMMKMMASGPLQKLIDFQIKRLTDIFS
jgi:carbon monoxide dehydrogenase subunit G